MTASELSPQRRTALMIVVMVATMMQILDSTIANVALPHMQAALGAAPDSISWVLTSYIVATAVATPVTGWLESRVGRRSLIVVSVVAFTGASMLCGVSTSLEMMVASRMLQGVAGAFIGPLAQAIMLDIYPPDQRARAITIWGMGIMAGPVLGPILGGLLTENYNWRWVFFINVPFGVVSTIGLLLLMPKSLVKKVPLDIVGFALIAAALCALQLVLDRGSQLDWFDSSEILIEAGVAAAMFWMFAVHTANSHAPLLPLALFRDRNFVVANMFVLLVLGIMMSGAVLLPSMMQNLLGYSVVDSGLLVVPRAFAIIATMSMSSRLIGKVDARIVIFSGMVMIDVGQWMMTGFSLEMDRTPIFVTGVIQGLGFGLVMLPLNIIAFATLPSSLQTNASALYSLSRNIGSSIAIAVFTALLARNLQVSHADLAAHMSVIRFPFLEGGLLEQTGISTGTALSVMDAEINRQAMMIAYLDDFWLMALLTMVAMPLVLLLSPVKASAGPNPHAVME